MARQAQRATATEVGIMETAAMVRQQYRMLGLPDILKAKPSALPSRAKTLTWGR